MVNLLFQKDGRCIIHHACSTKNFGLVEFLLQQDSSITEPNDAGWTPLHIAAAVGSIEIVRLLVERLFISGLPLSSSLDATDSMKCTPLHRASGKGYVDICELLLSNGASSTLQDMSGNTALHRAASVGHLEICKCLVKYGAPLNSQNNERKLPM